MAEQPIKKGEIIEDGIFSNLLKEADIVIAKEKQIIATNKELLKTYRDIANATISNNSDGLKNQSENAKNANKSINDLKDSEIRLIEVKKAKVLLQQEEVKLAGALDREQKRLARSLNDLNGSYKKGTQDLANLKKQLKELEFTGRTNGKLYKALTNEFNNLDAKVRKAEKSVGEFQRNVGNYPKALDGIGAKLAGAFSVGAIIGFGKKVIETRAEFQKFEAVLTNTLGSSSAAKRSLEEIQQIAAKTPFSVKELTESYVKLVNQGFKPTTAEITKLGDLAASQGKSFDQLTEGIIDAQTGEFERLKEFGIKASKSGDKVSFSFKGVKTTVKNTGEEINKYILSLGELEGVSGGMAAISETLGGKISNLGDNFDTFFNNLGENSEGVFAFFLNQFNDFLGLVNDAEKSINKINAALKKGGSEQTFIDKAFGGNTQLVALQQNLDAIARSGNGNVQNLKNFGLAIDIVKEQLANGSISQKEYSDSLILIGSAINSERQALEDSRKVKEKDNSLTKEQIKLAKEFADAERDLQNQLIKLRIDNTELDKRREIDNAENENKLAKEKLAQGKGKNETKLAIEVELNEKLRQDLIAINDKYNKIDFDRKKEEEEKAKKAEDDFNKEFLDKAQEQADNLQSIADKNKEVEEKKQTKLKEKQKAQLDEALQFEQQLIDAVAKAEAEKSEKRIDGFDKQISDQEKAIDTQRKLAENGKRNTLAEEEARKIQLEKQKEDEKKREIKRQKALAFFKLFASYAEKDPNTALQKALKDTVIAEAVSAAFIDGTENVGKDKQFAKNKFKDGEDGFVARFDGDERIINPGQNKMIGNMSNEDLAKLAYDYNNGLLDTVKYTAIPSADFGKNVQDSALLMQTIQLNKKIESLEQTIRDRPVTSWEMTAHGDYIERRIAQGIKTNITHKVGKRI